VCWFFYYQVYDTVPNFCHSWLDNSLFITNTVFSSLAICDFAEAEDKYLRKNIITLTKIIYIMTFLEKMSWNISIVRTPRVSISYDYNYDAKKYNQKHIRVWKHFAEIDEKLVQVRLLEFLRVCAEFCFDCKCAKVIWFDFFFLTRNCSPPIHPVFIIKTLPQWLSKITRKTWKSLDLRWKILYSLICGSRFPKLPCINMHTRSSNKKLVCRFQRNHTNHLPHEKNNWLHFAGHLVP